MTYKRYSLLVVLSLILIIAGHSANAVTVEGLNQANISVTSQSNTQRRSALKQALAEVIVKNTGSIEALNYPLIKDALALPTSYLRQYSYINNDDKLALQVNFDESKILALLRNAKVSIWEKNRPLTLLWITYDTDINQQILSDSSSEVVVSEIKQASKINALPLIFPILDLSELNMISESDIKGYFIDAFPKVSEKYQVDYLILANIQQSQSGFQYQLKLYQQEQDGVRRPILTKQSSIFDNSASLANDLVRKLTVYFANEYSISVEEKQQSVSIKFEQVINLETQIKIKRYLSQLAIVKSVHISQLQGAKLTFDLTLYGSLQDLQRVLSRDHNIRSNVDQDILSSEAEPQIYQWVAR
ncbi:DUF2066 domain-containing protein [Parashewanella curva]|uniref:DUF2066 domain-containing protein n=1 Tax=Parashewanella curva TaxID=2338552 RepID=A0A3L8PSU7_9GAMM|nr:DUF2066 domain-containing protein [Parashewanella curva]RLV58471.1 DUF2066 domain-containing protein [Parashewanella curva]